jgi:sugar phosphate isomerase/epimerase
MGAIKGMNFGLKLWARNYKYVEQAADLIRGGVFDYLEIMPEPGYDNGIYPRDIKYVIHAEKFNPADPSSKYQNRSMMRRSIEWADALGSEIIIVHPGFGAFEHSFDFINDEEWSSDKRIIIENMPFVIDDKRGVLGNSPAEIKRFGRPICLDIGHMISSSVSHGADYTVFLDGFLELKPAMAHVMDGYRNAEHDQHLAISEGDYDLRSIVGRLIDARVPRATLETPGFIPEDSAAQLNRLRSLLY